MNWDSTQKTAAEISSPGWVDALFAGPPTAEQLAAANSALRNLPPGDILRLFLRPAAGRAVVSTNFRPYEAVLLHLAVTQQADIPVLWVDHGYNRPATYRHAERLRTQLQLNLRVYVPRVTAAWRDAVQGPVPDLADEAGLKQFSAQMKLEPFQRGMRELAPRLWITALRRSQNAHRASLDILGYDAQFQTLKLSPLLDWSDDELEAYLRRHHLPNEWDYFDPAKADEKRECGLHAAWGANI